jgi:hypothetical protein
VTPGLLVVRPDSFGVTLREDRAPAPSPAPWPVPLPASDSYRNSRYRISSCPLLGPSASPLRTSSRRTPPRKGSRIGVEFAKSKTWPANR